MSSPTKLSGKVIGTPGSYGNFGSVIARAFDGNLSTFFDAPVPSGAWCGLDLGQETTITSISYAARSGFSSRMVGGQFQGSNSADFTTGVTTLFTIAAAPPNANLFSHAVTGKFRYVRYLGPTGSSCNISEMQVFGIPPAAVVVTNPNANPAQQVDTVPTYYISNSGNDNNSGLTPSSPKKSIKPASNTTLFLLGEIFDIPASSPIAYNDLINATITTDPANRATLRSAVASPGALEGPNMISWSTSSTGCALSNVIIDSPDGKGFGGKVRGTNFSLNNVLLKNLTEGFDWVGVNGVNITGGGQIGSVQGRCHYFLGCKAFSWVGDPAMVFGPAVGQSPIRFSTDVGGPYVNNSGGTITGVNITQAGSPNPIACVAGHNLIDITINKCTCNGGEFSFDGAGEGLGDIVSGCIINNLTIINSKLYIGPVAFKNTYNNPVITNLTGECISVQTGTIAGNVINGGNLTSPIHGVHYYSVNDTVVKNSTLNTNGHPNAPMIDGANSPTNDGGGNQVR